LICKSVVIMSSSWTQNLGTNSCFQHH
jgi:hypothetical protein